MAEHTTTQQDLYTELQELKESAENTLALANKMTAEVDALTEQNAELRIENVNLRNRLNELSRADNGAADTKNGLSKSKKNLEKLYEQGYHVCQELYGKRREDKEECAFCLEVIYGTR
ncbi:initiation control protein YabA [Schleiferilactobacillus shenzhenensis]|uniref:initiation control protein YabA n=1 Tax=Schleiferilactobacillus shenzhenensis TaxID=1231337 RepID=UPI00041AAD7B|nr:initiation control protein YabA [Schleiferilactobacillus shenzhenensis]